MKSPTTFLRENQVTKAVAKKIITPAQAAEILITESVNFSGGSNVYIAFGIGAGSYGTFRKEINGGMCQVDLKNGGTYNVPAIFLRKV